MAKGGKGGGGLTTQDWMEAAKQQSILTGTKNINDTFDKQFTPDFFSKIQSGYMDYVNPQLDKQYGDAQKQLTYALARTGNLDSSTRADQFGDLTQQYNQNKQTTAGDAITQANAAKTAVNSSRSNLIAALNATGDAAGAANNATSQAAALSAQPTYSPLGDMFNGLTSALATQGQMMKLSALMGGGSGGGMFSGTGLYGTPTNAVKVS